MTDNSFMEGRGLSPVKIPHLGPASAAKLVSAYGCHVHPLKLGSKLPATERGVLDAELDATAITGNYGVAMGASNLVAVDLDDYKDGNQCEQFIADLELPPTFTVLTGSGGRSLWYRAPVSADVPPGQNVLGYSGVDLRGSNSYALGPGNKLHPDNIKPGAPGDGNYTFDKASPKEFTQLPLSLLTALAKERAAKEAKREDAQKHSGTSAAFEALDESVKKRVVAYVDKAVSAIMSEFDEMQNWEIGHHDEHGGWEQGVLDRTASLASLVKADWNDLGVDDVVGLLEKHLPTDASVPRSIGVSKFERAMDNDTITARAPGFSLEPEDDEWFEGEAYSPSRPFGEAGDAPGAEPASWPKEAWNEEGHVERTKMWAAGGMYWLEDEEIWVKYRKDLGHWVKDVNAGPAGVQAAMKIARFTEVDQYDNIPEIDKDGQPKPGSSDQEKFVKMMSDQSSFGMFDRAAKALALGGELTKRGSEFDADPMMLAVKGGAINLRKGEFVKGTPELKMTVSSTVKFDSEATAPKFQRYLETSMPDVTMREYLQTAIGYSVTNSTKEQAFFIHWGPQTNNGKSVLFNLIRVIMGSQMAAASSKALIRSRNDKHSVEIADLAGPRILQMGETAEGAALEEDVIKSITGSDEIAARKIQQSNRDWRIKGKIHILTNHLPHISASPSMKRRTHLIVWPVEITDVNLDLEDEIKAAEMSGVLNWVIAGCLKWQENLKKTPEPGTRKTGLIRPIQALMDLERYMEEEDQLSEWLTDRTEEGGPTKSSLLYEDYRIWCFPKGTKPMSATAFGRKLRERKIEKIEKSAGNFYDLVLTSPNGYLS